MRRAVGRHSNSFCGYQQQSRLLPERYDASLPSLDGLLEKTAALLRRFRIRLANRLLDLGLIEAAKRAAPEVERGKRVYRF